MRTADRIIEGSWYFPFGLEEGSRPFLADLADDLPTCPVLLADNIAAYMHQQRRPFDMKALPALSPPWPQFWIEYGSSGSQRRGVWVMDCTDMEPPGADEDPQSVPTLVAAARRNCSPRWVIVLDLLIERGKRVWGPAGMVAVALDDYGAVLATEWSAAPLLVLGDKIAEVAARGPLNIEEFNYDEEMVNLANVRALSETDFAEAKRLAEIEVKRLGRLIAEDEARIDEISEALSASEAVLSVGSDREGWLMRAMSPALQTIAFLHCKNVVVEEVRPAAKVQAKRAKRGRPGLVRYQTVRLDVPRKQSAGSGGGHRDVSFHIVAGHFAHYGDCCPSQHEPHGLLFGRLSGVHWVPSHARGDREVGEVQTDFDLVI